MEHVRYMERIRDYYIAQGYEKSYEWAHFDEIPFTPLDKPLSECRVTLLSTSDVSVVRDDDAPLSAEETTVGAVYSLPWSTSPEKLYSRQESYDRYATSLDDINAYLPITRLEALAREGIIGGVTERFHNVNRGYSKRLMMETAAPAALERCREDNADVALLVPV